MSTQVPGSMVTEESADHQDTAERSTARGRARTRGLRRWLAPWADAVVTAVASGVLFLVGFGGGPGRLSLPLGRGDLWAAYAQVSLWSHGAPFGDSTLGYPFGMNLRYYPTADVLQNFLGGVVAAITGSTFFGLNFVYAISFPVAALAALWVLRLVGLRGPLAVVLALAYTTLPWHWLRSEHVYLATMYSAAMAVGLAIVVGSGGVEERLRRKGWLRGGLPLLGVCVVIGLSGIYYACFAVLLCVVALVFRVCRGASWRSVGIAGMPVVGVIGALGAALLPAVLYSSSHPALGSVAGRIPFESIQYSGVLALALLPSPMSRMPGMGPVNELVQTAYTSGSVSPSSGVVWFGNAGSILSASAILFILVGVVVLARRSSRSGMAATWRDPDVHGADLPLLVGLCAVVVLFLVPWGLNFLFANFVTAQLRGWDRLLPVLFMLVFAMAGVVWRAVVRRPRAWTAWVLVAVSSVVLVFDGAVSYRGWFGDMATTGEQELVAGRAYADAVNTAVPARCGVLQLPYVDYPEVPPVVGLDAYAHFSAALTNTDKLWSFGAMKQTFSSAWADVLESRVDTQAVDDLRDAGFCLVHVDLRGFTSSDGAAVMAQLSGLLGAPVATGHDGQWVAYELPSPASGFDGLDAADDELRGFLAPARVEVPPGQPVAVTEGPFEETWAVGAGARLLVEAVDDSATFSSVEGVMRAAACDAPQNVTIALTAADGSVATWGSPLQPGVDQPFDLRLDASTARADLDITVDGGSCTAPDGTVSSAMAVDLRSAP